VGFVLRKTMKEFFFFYFFNFLVYVTIQPILHSHISVILEVDCVRIRGHSSTDSASKEF